MGRPRGLWWTPPPQPKKKTIDDTGCESEVHGDLPARPDFAKAWASPVGPDGRWDGEHAAHGVSRGIEQGRKQRLGSAADPAECLPAASEPGSFSMRPYLYVCLLALPLSLWAQGTPEAPIITASGPHSSTWTWTETGWDDLGQPVTTEHNRLKCSQPGDPTMGALDRGV
jgi:hypothetical protein